MLEKRVSSIWDTVRPPPSRVPWAKVREVEGGPRLS
jgi:hypothetical protein